MRAARLLVDEQLYDFAASRAYYSMFYVASALLIGKGLSFSKHSGVISAFGQHFAKTGEVEVEFHRYLIEGEYYRHEGDYSPNMALTEAQAAAQIQHAQAFLTLAEQMLAE